MNIPTKLQINTGICPDKSLMDERFDIVYGNLTKTWEGTKIIKSIKVEEHALEDERERYKKTLEGIFFPSLENEWIDCSEDEEEYENEKSKALEQMLALIKEEYTEKIKCW